MSVCIKQELQNFALRLDQMPFKRLDSALQALAIYEKETDQWIADWEAEAEERGEDFDTVDACGAEYDAYCDKLGSWVLRECHALEDDMALAMEVLCDDWVQVTNLMQDNAKRDIVVETMRRL